MIFVEIKLPCSVACNFEEYQLLMLINSKTLQCADMELSTYLTVTMMVYWHSVTVYTNNYY